MIWNHFKDIYISSMAYDASQGCFYKSVPKLKVNN